MSKKNYHHGDLKNSLVNGGISILAKEGVPGLTLRKLARKAGVSHTAPYAHFSDKQALIAAISTEGFKRLYEAMDIAIAAHSDRALEQLVAGAWAYIQFGLNEPDHFKVTFSGILEKEKDYPAFVEVSQQTFRRVVSIVEACQREKALRTDQPEVFAVSIWALLLGLASLLIEGQISHCVLDHHSIEEIFVTALSPFLLACTDPYRNSVRISRQPQDKFPSPHPTYIQFPNFPLEFRNPVLRSQARGMDCST